MDSDIKNGIKCSLKIYLYNNFTDRSYVSKILSRRKLSICLGKYFMYLVTLELIFIKNRGVA